MPRQRHRGMNFPKRLTEWGATEAQPAPISVASGASAIMFAFDNRTSRIGESTIIRRRGLLVLSTANVSVDADITGAVGSCIVNGEAFDAGVLSVPTPVAEAEDDRWFWHQYFAINTRFDTSPITMFPQYVVDSKAMRKFTATDVLITVIENTSAAVPVSWWFQARTLFKLH